MIDTFTLLLSSQLKRSQVTQKTGGFTLTELLVAMILAALVITPLLTFMTSIMNTDRQEQAKATSEQELQAALDYIAQDLEQAVYIYDADGLMREHSDTAANSGIKNQIPPAKPVTGCSDATTCQPVLVFWKREYNRSVVPLRSDAPTGSCAASPTSCNDTFVYSLVGYYLIKDDTPPSTWSKAARIGRFQIQDGVRAPNPADGTVSLLPYDPKTGPSKGFNLFDLEISGSTLKIKMNQWEKGAELYTDQTVVLLDYIDQSTTGVPPVACPTQMQAVPDYSNPSVSDTFKTYSFYACVNSARTLAQVYLRGNALARIKNGVVPYSASNSAYFPQASIQVKGRGFLDSK